MMDEEDVYISRESRTKLPGESTTVLDLGSMVNCIGANTLKQFEDKMAPHGHSAQYEARAIAFNLTGVGSGAARCPQQAIIAIAIQFKDKPATLEHLKSNVATGSGADLPSIMGKTSATAKDSVVLLREGKEQLVFPGPGGYKIEWSPGTKIMDFKSAPSGHLVFNCDKYDAVTTDRAPRLHTWFSKQITLTI